MSEDRILERKPLDIKVRLERQEKKIIQIRKQLEEAQDKYDELLKEQREEDKKKLLAAYDKSKRNLDEVIDFMKGKADI